MYLTHSLVAINKGKLDYLFFYLTEDYVEDQIALTQQLGPLLEELGRNLLDKGAVVKPFKKDIATINREVRDKFDQEFSREMIISINHNLEKPGLLIINSDFEDFDPKEHPWLYISLRDFLDERGALKIFRMKELFDFLTSAVLNNKNLFEEAKNYLRKGELVSAHKMIELKPGIFGVSLDLKEAFNFIKRLKH